MKVPTLRRTRVRDYEMLAFYASGWTKEQLAEFFNLDLLTVRQILAVPEYTEVLHAIKKKFIHQALTNAAEIVDAHTVEAALTMVTLMRNATSETVRFNAARDLLDRGGLKARDVVEIRGNGLSDDAAKLIAEAIKETKIPETTVEMVEDSAGIFKPMAGGYGEPI